VCADGVAAFSLNRRSMRHRFFLTLSFLVPSLGGCYAYEPVTDTRPLAGHRVRLTLTDAGTANLGSQLGSSAEALSGRLVNDSAGAYLVAVLGTRTRSGLEADWKGEQVAIPRPFVARVEERRFSRTRTALVSVGLIAAALIAREAFLGETKSFPGQPPGSGPGPR
jgi:hypothetical protein